MNTLQKVNRFVQQLVEETVPKRLQHRVLCGVQAFSLQAFISINANGRSLARNRKTGESRTYRTLHDVRSASLVRRLLFSLLPKNQILYCSLDHSQFGPFSIAVLAVSVRMGRALPLWCQARKQKTVRIKPLLKALERLAQELPPEQKIVLVMDRWFCGPRLFNLLMKHHWYFICRTKSDRRVRVPWEERGSLPVGEISHEETTCVYQELDLRLVRSEFRPGMKQNEPWFLLTNLPPDVASRVQVLHRYAERFEIEEVFKDMKWLQRFEWQQVKKVAVMQTLLLFVFFGWWIAWALYRGNHQLQKVRRNTNPKHRLSWYRSISEELHKLFWPDILRFTPLLS